MTQQVTAPDDTPASATVDHAGTIEHKDSQQMLENCAPNEPESLRPDDLDDPGQEVHQDTITDEYGPLVLIDGNRSTPNQIAIAARYAHDEDAAFSEIEGKHFLFSQDEGIYVAQSLPQAVRSVSSYVKRFADRLSTPDILAKRTQAFCKGILKFLESVSPMRQPPSPERMLVAVKNGVLDLSGDEPKLLPHSREYGFTQKLPWSYNPDAKCDRFLEELLYPALPDMDDVALLQRDFGRQLISGNRAQTISLMFGDGGSGKSVLASLHEHIVGTGRVANLRTHLLHASRFETHDFHGKCVLLGKDVHPEFLNNGGAAVLKSLTGADRLQTEKKFGGKFELRGTFFVIVTSNGKLLLLAQQDMTAWRRRLVVYFFSRTPPEKRVANFDEVLLREEGDGILAWYVRGFMQHKEELEQHGRLVLTDKQQRRVDDLLMESDGQREFLKMNVVKGAGTLSVEEIWQAYVFFARERGWRIPSKQAFCTELPEVMLELFGVERDNHIMRMRSAVRGYKGVNFTDDVLRNLNREVC